MLAGIRISIFRECEYLHVEGLSMAFGGMVGDSIPGLHAVGILTVLGLAQTGVQSLHSFQESLESVNQGDSMSILTKNEVCALLQSKGEIVTFPSLSFCRQQKHSLPVFQARD